MRRALSSCVTAMSSSSASLSAPAASVASQAAKRPHRLAVDELNPQLLKAEYAVRGRIPQRAAEIAQEIAGGSTKYPFKDVVLANIGNPQALKQKPITYFRQVLSLLENNDLLEDPEKRKVISSLYPEDVIQRAVRYRDEAGVVIGAYTSSQGLPMIRQEVADYISERDGFPANPNDIFFTSGASEGIALMLGAIIAKPSVGVMIPIPQYPLYTATITLCNGVAVGYYLDESANWDLKLDELTQRLKEARQNGTEVRAIAVINPGNPTGQVLTESSIRDILSFAHREGLVVLADEVYQANIYKPELPFVSFKKVLKSMPECRDSLELASFHSLSKGVLGECGRRGGYMELVNFDKSVREQLLKRASINLCSNVAAQVMVGMMCRPPKAGEPSYELYKKETSAQLESLKRRAQKLAGAFNSMEGLSCNEPTGAMYLFPRIYLSDAAIKAAEEAKMAPDAFYALNLLESTGLCVVPGSGFGQQPGTHHVRCTFLPPEHEIDGLIDVIRQFQQNWNKKYGVGKQ